MPYQRSFLLSYGYVSLLNHPNSHQVFLRSVLEEGHRRQIQELFSFSYHGIDYGQPAYLPVAHS